MDLIFKPGPLAFQLGLYSFAFMSFTSRQKNPSALLTHQRRAVMSDPFLWQIVHGGLKFAKAFRNGAAQTLGSVYEQIVNFENDGSSAAALPHNTCTDDPYRRSPRANEP